MSKEIREMIDKVKNFEQSMNENYNNEFTTGHFIVGDEVYLVGGDGEPFGMVIKIGDKNIYIKPHDAHLMPIVVKKPTELYLGKEWHDFNISKKV